MKHQLNYKVVQRLTDDKEETEAVVSLAKTAYPRLTPGWLNGPMFAFNDNCHN